MGWRLCATGPSYKGDGGYSVSNQQTAIPPIMGLHRAIRASSVYRNAGRKDCLKLPSLGGSCNTIWNPDIPEIKAFKLWWSSRIRCAIVAAWHYHRGSIFLVLPHGFTIGDTRLHVKGGIYKSKDVSLEVDGSPKRHVTIMRF